MKFPLFWAYIPMMRKATPIKERFWRRIQKTEDCWLWTGCVDLCGYGRLSRKGSGPCALVHRFAWEIQNSPIPKGNDVRQLCGNRRCVNPSHLFLKPRPTLSDRFWAKVDKTEENTDCWIWIGSLDTKGDGHLIDDTGKLALVHRVSWKIHNGPIPVNHDVHHTCRTLECVRPSHLYLVKSPRGIPIEERFWSKVNKGKGCWEWLASVDGSNRGHLGIDGKMRTAHRVAWELTNGPIPDGFDVLHSCDNGRCCRPDHLSLGTHVENMGQMAKRGRAGQRGERHWKVKLKEEDIPKIRKSRLRVVELARAFGVTSQTICGIKVVYMEACEIRS